MLRGFVQCMKVIDSPLTPDHSTFSDALPLLLQFLGHPIRVKYNLLFRINCFPSTPMIATVL